VLGQDYFTYQLPQPHRGPGISIHGYVHGSGGNFSDAGMAIDNSSGTPHLYVADPYNNRVLGFKDLRTFQNGAKNLADIVLGQADFTTALINYPSGNPNTPTSPSLFRPVGLLVDAKGNLYVADSLNGRVLRFPAPFAYTGAAPEPADLVLGQSNFTATITDPTATNMVFPTGWRSRLRATPVAGVRRPQRPGGLRSVRQPRALHPHHQRNVRSRHRQRESRHHGLRAEQFQREGSGSTLAAMTLRTTCPATPTDYVYVADTGNNRVLIFPDPHAAGTASYRRNSFRLHHRPQQTPSSVYASPVTGEIWVANTGGGNSLRYANYQSVLLGLGSINGIVEASDGCPAISAIPRWRRFRTNTGISSWPTTPTAWRSIIPA
jgi:hypothetical protein